MPYTYRFDRPDYWNTAASKYYDLMVGSGLTESVANQRLQTADPEGDMQRYYAELNAKNEVIKAPEVITYNNEAPAVINTMQNANQQAPVSSTSNFTVPINTDLFSNLGDFQTQTFDSFPKAVETPKAQEPVVNVSPKEGDKRSQSWGTQTYTNGYWIDDVPAQQAPDLRKIFDPNRNNPLYEWSDSQGQYVLKAVQAPIVQREMYTPTLVSAQVGNTTQNITPGTNVVTPPVTHVNGEIGTGDNAGKVWQDGKWVAQYNPSLGLKQDQQLNLASARSGLRRQGTYIPLAESNYTPPADSNVQRQAGSNLSDYFGGGIAPADNKPKSLAASRVETMLSRRR